MLAKQAIAAAGLSLPRRQGAFAYSATPVRRGFNCYGELETIALTRTGRWKVPRSADRYPHGAVSEESRRADRLL
jgi:hypothetical protein